MTEPCTEKETISVLKAYQADIRGDVKDIKKALLGDDKEGGVITRVKLHQTFFKIIAVLGSGIIIFLTSQAIWGWIGN